MNPLSEVSKAWAFDVNKPSEQTRSQESFFIKIPHKKCQFYGEIFNINLFDFLDISQRYRNKSGTQHFVHSRNSSLKQYLYDIENPRMTEVLGVNMTPIKLKKQKRV